ncbi:MAG: tRNA (guanosine(37)-N1)-methyltransferase TrmD [Candidatus Levybacteria bacterium CG10_big_fil_rev_8_21_14_0_10_36_7]|nr:MAG: tRNA (guanosine(37)-N1)-methyltransferase TrmD [Candidatus Levybacteria bacterium CG10_big_fil_rev_8_21_14_0_10_36_7]
MNFYIITLFEESIKNYLNSSIIGRAQKDKKIKISFYNPRNFTKDKHKRVDKKPYGGGPGMVLEAGSVIKAVEKAIGKKKNVLVIFFSPSGVQFTNTLARGYLKKYKHIVFICGHYEGVDARVKKIFKAKEISIGPYILTGGELPASVMIDVISRQVRGVLGKYESVEEERISNKDVYTRPEVFEHKGKKYKVPKVLLSGHHKNIEEWKKRV